MYTYMTGYTCTLTTIPKSPISRFDTPICSIHQPRNSLSYELFLVIRNLMGLEQIQLCCQRGNFGQLSYNMHKSKMAARTHLEH